MDNVEYLLKMYDVFEQRLNKISDNVVYQTKCHFALDKKVDALSITQKTTNKILLFILGAVGFIASSFVGELIKSILRDI